MGTRSRIIVFSISLLLITLFSILLLSSVGGGLTTGAGGGPYGGVKSRIELDIAARLVPGSVA